MTDQILIIGTGFAGLWSALSAARLLDKEGRTDISVTVLAPQPELVIRPRLYEKNATQLRAPLTDLFKAVGVNYVQGHARQINTEQHNVTYVDNSGREGTLQFSKLILASGSRIKPAKGADTYAFNVDQLESAVELEQHLHALKNQPSSEKRNTIVIAGGGFTGIETATEMPVRLREIFGNDTGFKVIMVDRGTDVGAALGENPRPLVAEALSHAGVEVILNNTIVSVNEQGATLADGQFISSQTVIWTAGVVASPLTSQIQAARDSIGRLHVDEYLKVQEQKDIFASGDVAYAATDDQGNHALMSCQHAIALGRFAGNNAVADLLGITPVPYQQAKYVTCLDLGDWGAIFTEGWDREVKLVKAEAKSLKNQINTQWIYPPVADRAIALAAADPAIPVVA